MRTLRSTSITMTAISSVLVLAGSGLSPAGAAQRPQPSWHRTINSSAVMPFQVTRHRGSVYFGDGYAGTVTKITRRGQRVVARVKGGISGVEFARRGKTMAFTASTDRGNTLRIKRPGRRAVIGHLKSYESRINPDAGQTYGVVAGGNECANEFFAQISGGPATYQGLVDSNPYQVESLRRGAWAVADAGGNSILKVNRRGRVSTLALLPPQPMTFTQAQVDAMDAPDCIVGVTYAFEPVPTDVERGPKGSLWVSTLPGGPEDPSLGARGSVYRISRHGDVRRMATGFLGATNLAVTPRGVVYVSELFGGQITRVAPNGARRQAVAVGSPVAVEATRSHLYVGVLGNLDFETGEVLAPGRIARFRR